MLKKSSGTNRIKLGDFFENAKTGDVYILASTERDNMHLVCITDGKPWTYVGGYFSDRDNITYEQANNCMQGATFNKVGTEFAASYLSTFF